MFSFLFPFYRICASRNAPEEIATLYAFLGSSEAAYITGQNIPIDGGELA